MDARPQGKSQVLQGLSRHRTPSYLADLRRLLAGELSPWNKAERRKYAPEIDVCPAHPYMGVPAGRGVLG
jgi:hypothetical protein